MQEEDFNRQLTMRVYNVGLINKLNKVFNICRKNYTTKNPFLVECLRRGVDDLEKAISNGETPVDVTELCAELSKNTKAINDLILLIDRKSKENKAEHKISHNLLSCNYRMLLGLSQDDPLDADFVDSGMVDDLPERFDLMLEALQKELNIK